MLSCVTQAGWQGLCKRLDACIFFCQWWCAFGYVAVKAHFSDPLALFQRPQCLSRTSWGSADGTRPGGGREGGREGGEWMNRREGEGETEMERCRADLYCVTVTLTLLTQHRRWSDRGGEEKKESEKKGWPLLISSPGMVCSGHLF